MLIVHTFKLKTISVAKVQHELKGSYFCTVTAVCVALVQHKKIMTMGVKFVLNFGNMKRSVTSGQQKNGWWSNIAHGAVFFFVYQKHHIKM